MSSSIFDLRQACRRRDEIATAAGAEICRGVRQEMSDLAEMDDATLPKPGRPKEPMGGERLADLALSRAS
jgi:hypothetical protein